MRHAPALIIWTLMALAITQAIGADTPALRAANPTPAATPPPKIDLSPRFESFGIRTGRQGQRGTCSVFTVVGALEFASAATGRPHRPLSVEYLNWAANQAIHENDDGSFFSDLWKGLELHGISTSEAYPYQPRFAPEAAPPEEARAEAGRVKATDFQIRWIKEWDVKTGLTPQQLEGIRRTLSEGWPVCGGFRWPKKEQWQDSVLQMCPAEEVFDGHSVLLVGYADQPDLPGGGLFRFRNSAKEGRDGQMPYAYALAYMNDALSIRPRNPTAAAP